MISLKKAIGDNVYDVAVNELAEEGPFENYHPREILCHQVVEPYGQTILPKLNRCLILLDEVKCEQDEEEGNQKDHLGDHPSFVFLEEYL